MEQRNVFLHGIATALNAFGSALVSVYDLTASTLGNVWQGEKEKPNGKIREYEQKIERLYAEVGKEISKDNETTRLSAAGEAALSLIAEYRLEMEKIKQGIQSVAKTERPEKETAPQEKEPVPMEKGPEPEAPVIAAPVAEAEEKIEEESKPEENIAEPSPAETTVTLKASPDLEMEAEKEIPAEPVTDTRDSEVPLTAEAPSEAEKETEKEASPDSGEPEQEKPVIYTQEMLGNKLKGDLLALCTAKGLEADKSMTKAEIIELLMRQS